MLSFTIRITVTNNGLIFPSDLLLPPAADSHYVCEYLRSTSSSCACNITSFYCTVNINLVRKKIYAVSLALVGYGNKEMLLLLKLVFFSRFTLTQTTLR